MKKVYIIIIALALLLPVVYVIYSLPCDKKETNPQKQRINSTLRSEQSPSDLPEMPPPPKAPPLPEMPPMVGEE